MKKLILSAGLLFAAMSTLHAQNNNNHNFEISKNLEIFNDIYKQLDLFYVDSLSADTVIGWAIDGMLQQVDPFTEYYPENNMEELREMTTGKYAGVGSVIRYYKKEDRVMMVEPWENSPATEAGIKAGDIILSIDGADMKGKSVSEVSKLLRGDAGTSFELKVKRDGVAEPLTFKVTRRNITVPPVPYYGKITDNVGYIYFDRFTENCSRDVRRAIIDLKEKGAKSLIIDMRSNPGGLLSEAIEIVNLFVPKGQKVVYTKGKLASVNSEYSTSKEPLDTEIPVVILVNSMTASSAEILSGSLQDFDRAVIMGQRTYGKGLVQVPREVPYHGSLKITTSRYYIPSGRCIQAYDYRHLNPDGSAGTVPDSLTNVFHTAAGREVRDGGGIAPDVVIPIDSLPALVYDVVSSDVALEYECKYASKHPTIAPAGEFSLTDEDYAEFVNLLKENNFTYKKRTEEVMNILKQTAKLEGCFDEAAPEFEALQKKMAGNLDADMARFKKDIKRYLENDLVSRYYFRKGAILQQTRDDNEIKAAIELLSDPARYNALLKPKAETTKSAKQ